MAKIYLSSTYKDLAEARAAVYRVLRKMGHDVVAMEDYVSQETKLAGAVFMRLPRWG